MRSNRAHGMSVLVAALGLVSARAAAEPAAAEPATEPAATAPASATQPTPRVAAAPASGPRGTRATWQEGFMVVPIIGINSFQGDSGRSTGPGLRLGLLAGSRLTELLSLNVGFAFDIANLDAPPGGDASRYVFDIGFNPLFHVPLQKPGDRGGAPGGRVRGLRQHRRRRAVGRYLGLRLDRRRERRGAVPGRHEGPFGWSGQLLSPQSAQGLREMDTCASEGLNSVKTLALSFAAML